MEGYTADDFFGGMLIKDEDNYRIEQKQFRERKIEDYKRRGITKADMRLMGKEPFEGLEEGEDI